jgi:beta-lactamase superfamily II metal-dependent hydrolase
MEIHIVEVGCGSMAILMNPDNSVFVLDCNITEDNKASTMAYVAQVLGRGTSIDVFINSHRDADHMRGIRNLHQQNPIKKIWDTGVPGTTTDSPEYGAYMALLRELPTKTLEPRKYYEYGAAKYRVMNAQWPDYSDPNQQSVVLKVEYKSPSCSVMFAGDTDYRPWKEKMLPHYSSDDLKSALLVAAHHGSLTFFDDPNDSSNYYTSHMKKISPDMTLVSVGPNSNNLPDSKAMGLYEKFSNGSDKGNKVHTTEKKHNMKITLKDTGGWHLDTNE